MGCSRDWACAGAAASRASAKISCLMVPRSAISVADLVDEIAAIGLGSILDLYLYAGHGGMVEGTGLFRWQDGLAVRADVLACLVKRGPDPVALADFGTQKPGVWQGLRLAAYNGVGIAFTLGRVSQLQRRLIVEGHILHAVLEIIGRVYLKRSAPHSLDLV